MKEPHNENMSEAILRMAVISEYYDPNIFQHVERIRRYAELLASGMGLSEIEASEMGYGCQLHDVGMVCVSQEITMKQGNLSNSEWETIKRHPQVGAALLSGSKNPIFQIAEQVALSHHERWDGSGYPDGLVGDKIPLAGRICGLIDVFDTITSKRSYKQEMDMETALLLIQEASGSFFDPDLVNLFTEKFTELKEIRKMQFSTPNVSTLFEPHS
jgi:putative two-component system response regulator